MCGRVGLAASLEFGGSRGFATAGDGGLELAVSVSKKKDVQCSGWGQDRVPSGGIDVFGINVEGLC